MDQTKMIYQHITKDSENASLESSINNTPNIKDIYNCSVNNEINNADEIFQILSQKIAKYCQILSDLTNCEVFFKSNLNNRSLYWGTYKMMFNYSHQGLQNDRNDSLIKISGRSLTSDIANIVEELINVENFDKAAPIRAMNEVNNEKQENNEVKLKDCIVLMDRLDDQLYDHYLEKMEKTRAFIDDDDYLSIEDMYYNMTNTSQLNETESSREHVYICEICNLNAYKHLPQLKFHILKEHQNIPFQDTIPYKCNKCNFDFDSNPEFLKHILLCHFPDIFTCKICQLELFTYSDFQCHVKYIHDSSAVYACTICQRRFKTKEELLDHDQLLHSKSSNYCEFCFESLKSRKELQEHYTNKHVITEFNNKNNIENSKIKSIKAAKHANVINNERDNIELDSKISYESIASISLDNESDNSKANIEDTEKNDSDESFEINNSNKAETKMQKNELIRGLLDRKHQCKWCAQRFYTKSQLRQHESTHSNTVLFCPVCDKEFSHKDRLAGHMKCHMEPSLECKICGKKFKRLCNLYNHELVHGLTEHAFMLCQFCGRGFRSRRDYQNHVIANHRDQLMKSEIIKNGNGVNESLNASSSSLLEDELRNNSKSLSTSNPENSDDYSIPLKNQNNNFPNSFLEDNVTGENNRDLKKSKQQSSKAYDKHNMNNTQLLVKAAEFVEDNKSQDL